MRKAGYKIFIILFVMGYSISGCASKNVGNATVESVEICAVATRGPQDMYGSGERKNYPKDSGKNRKPEAVKHEIYEDYADKGANENTGKLEVIDAGHKIRADTSLEPVEPGAEEMKMKGSGGTKGVSTGMYEYELNLNVALKLKDELTGRGYEVVMCRETNEINISNSQRAQIANDNGADAFIRIHTNGSENSKANGGMAICQTKDNPYNGDLYDSSKTLSVSILDELAASTGAHKEYVWETDTMSGINWCQVPVTIVEMGYMTNEKKDSLLATEEYQDKIAIGIANGIDCYFGF